MIHFGVDVGVTGAVAALDDDARLLGVLNLEVTRLGTIAWIEPMKLVRFINEHRAGRPARAWIELVAPLPKVSAVAGAAMGRTHGSGLAALQMAGIPFEMIQPSTWKRKLFLLAPNASDSQRKKLSLDKARTLFPESDDLDRMKDHNRAEAALIAYYGRMTWAQSNARPDLTAAHPF